MKHILWHIKGK